MGHWNNSESTHKYFQDFMKWFSIITNSKQRNKIENRKEKEKGKEKEREKRKKKKEKEKKKRMRKIKTRVVVGRLGNKRLPK